MKSKQDSDTPWAVRKNISALHPICPSSGKALANGFATAVVVGREEIMDEVSDVWVAATFHGEVSLVAAAIATIGELEAKGRCRLYVETGAEIVRWL